MDWRWWKRWVRQEKCAFSLENPTMTQSKRPSSIVAFEMVMYISMVYGGVITLLKAPEVDEKVRSIYTSFSILVVLPLTLLFVLLIARGRRNWAKWGYVMIYIISAPSTFSQILSDLKSSGITEVLIAVQVLVQTALLFLLFTPASRNWFKKDANA